MKKPVSPGRTRRLLVVLLGMAVLAACVGPREGAAPNAAEMRTKNASLADALSGITKLLKLTTSNTMQLSTSMGSIGYSLRVEFTGADPAFDVQYGTSSSNCSLSML